MMKTLHPAAMEIERVDNRWTSQCAAACATALHRTAQPHNPRLDRRSGTDQPQVRKYPRLDERMPCPPDP